MKTLFILLDSLNRHLLPSYGNDWVRAPNIARLAARGITFDTHFCGSLPCIPARRDLFTGRLCFLEAPWGSLEPWDAIAPRLLREGPGVYCHLITDHPHYFNSSAGDVYHNMFSSWEFMRGQTTDPWRALVEKPATPPGARIYCYNHGAHQHLANLRFRDAEKDEDYPTVQCFQRAAEFLDHNHGADRWHLHLEVFDPHEPFDCPQAYRALYGDQWNRPPYTCPPYGPLDPSADDPAAVEHIRRCYAAKLTMADRWLGGVLDRLDRYNLWKDTTVILTTDHGYLLGEHGLWAKNYMMPYRELSHLPLIVCHPDLPGGQRRRALTTAVDLMPTLLALHGVQAPGDLHGKSLLPLLKGDTPLRDGALFGYFGRELNVTDGRYTYCRAPRPGSLVYRYTTDLWRLAPALRAQAEPGLFLRGSRGIPHFRVRHDPEPYFNQAEGDLLHDLERDPAQAVPLKDPALERRLAELMIRCLRDADAPEEHYARLGLPRPGAMLAT